MILLPNSNWTQLIKQIAEEARKAAKPSDYFVGSVESNNPFKIRLSQKMILTSDFFLITQTLKNTTFQIGDRVLMLRKEGGQQYVLIDKVVDP